MMITRILATINRGGFEISLFLIVTGYFLGKKQNQLMRVAEMISLAIMATMTGVSHWIISARMLALRTAMQAPIDQIAISDPRRVAFDTLHGYSVAIMAIAVIAALIAFFLISIQSRRIS
jgi:cell division protein FtsL